MAEVRKYVLIHCPTSDPNGPYEVKGVDGTSIGTYDTLDDAVRVAEREAEKAGAKVIRSPLVQGHM